MVDIDPDELPPTLAEIFPPIGAEPIVGVGVDDCAVFRVGSQIVVASTDYVNASPISVELGIADEYSLGKYLVNANLSDLLGTGASPVGIMCALMLPRGFSRERYSRLTAGIQKACVDADIAVLGGDTKLSTWLALCATAIGTVTLESHLRLRSAAEVGHDIWVNGPLGSCAAATVGLVRGGMSVEWEAWAKDRVAHPVLPLKSARALARLEISAGGTDLSDGLGADLSAVCGVSAVGAVVDLNSIPHEPQVAELSALLEIEPGRFAFTVGGDLAFLVTAHRASRAAMANAGFHRIGSITIGGDCELVSNGQIMAMPRLGHRDAHKMSFADEIQYLLREGFE